MLLAYILNILYFIITLQCTLYVYNKFFCNSMLCYVSSTLMHPSSLDCITSLVLDLVSFCLSYPLSIHTMMKLPNNTFLRIYPCH